MNAFSRSLFVAAATAFSLMGAIPAHAANILNGIQINGIQINGIQINGIQINGRDSHGQFAVKRDANGVDRSNGQAEPVPAGLPRIEGLVLPDGRTVELQ
ncbi:hypothetical protein [Ideonella sp.]|uniref:hypothetical protein n=1 Tax=Ideonella sp. TaxID=1929293 RepID=UPI0035B32D78